MPFESNGDNFPGTGNDPKVPEILKLPVALNISSDQFSTAYGPVHCKYYYDSLTPAPWALADARNTATWADALVEVVEFYRVVGASKAGAFTSPCTNIVFTRFFSVVSLTIDLDENFYAAGNMTGIPDSTTPRSFTLAASDPATAPATIAAPAADGDTFWENVRVRYGV